MAIGESRNWLITYDIADRRRLGRLHRFIKKQAVPVQYSVYLFEGSPAQLGRMMQEIDRQIDRNCDDVRAYPIPADATVETLGRGSMPDGLAVLMTRQIDVTMRLLLRSEKRYD